MVRGNLLRIALGGAMRAGVWASALDDLHFTLSALSLFDVVEVFVVFASAYEDAGASESDRESAATISAALRENTFTPSILVTAIPIQ